MVDDCLRYVKADATDRPPDVAAPEGKRKKNVTPRTYENRLVAGVFEDVTQDMLAK